MALTDTRLRATNFERDHQTLIHLLIVGSAWSAYLVNRDDIVWGFVKNQGSAARTLERSVFLVATLLIGFGAYICTVAHLLPHQPTVKTEAMQSWRSLWFRDGRLLHYFGEALYAVGFASLLPLQGFIILIVGEMIRLGRLSLRVRREDVRQSRLNSATAVRVEILKWGIFVSMAVFTITLVDTYADVLIGSSFFVWIFVTWHFRPRRT